MIRVEATVVIDCPVEQVFAFLTDHRNDTLWQEGLLEVRVERGVPAGPGARVTAVRKLLGSRAESIIEIGEFIPNRKEVFRTVAGSLQVKGDTVYEPQDGRTIVTQRLEMQTRGFFTLADSLVAGTLRRNLVASLSEAKDLLEASAGQA